MYVYTSCFISPRPSEVARKSPEDGGGTHLYPVVIRNTYHTIDLHRQTGEKLWLTWCLVSCSYTHTHTPETNKNKPRNVQQTKKRGPGNKRSTPPPACVRWFRSNDPACGLPPTTQASITPATFHPCQSASPNERLKSFPIGFASPRRHLQTR